MLILAALASMLTVNVTDQSTIFLKRSSTRKSLDDRTFTPVWRRVGSQAEMRRLLRKRPGLGYAHVECGQILIDGRLSQCSTSTGDGGDASKFDPVMERAALRIIKRYRVDLSRLPFKRDEVNFVTIELRFKQPGTGPGNGWGDCFPFCGSGAPPPPPPPPARAGQL